MNKKTVKEIWEDKKTTMRSFSIQDIEIMMRVEERKNDSLNNENRKTQRTKIIISSIIELAQMFGDERDVRIARTALQRKQLPQDMKNIEFGKNMELAIYYSAVYSSLCVI